MLASTSTSLSGRNNRRGFTIVELLIVIVVIGILAAIVIVAYQGVQSRAQQAKIQDDQNTLMKAISAAQIRTGGSLKDVVLDFWIGQDCSSLAPGTDLATLPRSNSCWTRYLTALDRISTAGGVNIRNMVDPWGRPYWIDSNEAESSTTPCVKDDLAVYTVPTNSGSITNYVQLPFVTPGCI